MKNIFILLFFLVTRGFAQERQFPAVVTDADGNVFKGSILYKAWTLNPSSMVFMPDSGQQVYITPDQAAHVSITGRDIYIGAKVVRYDNPLHTDYLTFFDTEPAVEGYLFLRQLYKGPILSLYAYRTQDRVHYFVQDSTGQVETLRYIRYFQGEGSSTHLVERRIYLEQLRFEIAPENAKALQELDRTNWRDEDMIRLFKAINEQEGFSYAEQEYKAVDRMQRVFFGAGLAYISFEFKSVDKALDQMTFSSSSNPMFYAGYRLQGQRRLDRFAMQALAGYYQYETTGIYDRKGYSGEDVREQLDLETKVLFFAFEPIFAPVRNKQFEWEIGPAFHFKYPLSLESQRTTTQVGIDGRPIFVEQIPMTPRAHINLYFMTQFTLNRKHTLRFMYSPFQIVDDFGKSQPRERLIGLGYHFNLGL